MADLTEYVDAAARAQFAHDCPTRSFDALSQLEQYAYRLAVTPIVAAVAPLIERDAKVAALEEAAEQLQSGHRHQPTEQGDPAMTRAIFLAARWAIGLGWAFTLATALIWIWGGGDDRWASTGVVVGASVLSATIACALMSSGPFARLPEKQGGRRS